MHRTRLRPVIEFDPFEYRSNRPAPTAKIEAAPDAWAAFWRDSLADGGIEGLHPLPGTWVVPVSELDDTVLAQVVLKHFDEPTLDEYFGSLPGP